MKNTFFLILAVVSSQSSSITLISGSDASAEISSQNVSVESGFDEASVSSYATTIRGG